MKPSLRIITLLTLLPLVCTYAQNTSSGIDIRIKNKQAQTIYEAMTDVQEEGAAGHSYRTGKNINCWHINADMDDAKGKPIPQTDSRRYQCSMHIDSHGVVTVGE